MCGMCVLMKEACVPIYICSSFVNLVVVAAQRSKLVCKQRADAEQINSGHMTLTRKSM